MSLLLAACALLAAVGCDSETREKLTATVACTNACAAVETCGISDCVSRCEALGGDDTLLAGCTACLFAAGDSCWAAEGCATLCDPLLLDDPTCAGFCTGLAAKCSGVRNCMTACADLDQALRDDCLNCFLLGGETCDALAACPQCGVTVVSE